MSYHRQNARGKNLTGRQEGSVSCYDLYNFAYSSKEMNKVNNFIPRKLGDGLNLEKNKSKELTKT